MYIDVLNSGMANSLLPQTLGLKNEPRANQLGNKTHYSIRFITDKLVI